MDIKRSVETFQRIYNMLEDEESKTIYASRLMYAISGNFNDLLPCINSYVVRKHDAPFVSPIGHALNIIRTLPEDRDVVLYGAGKDGKLLLPIFKEHKRFIGFCSSTKEKQENGYLGYPVMSPEELLSCKNLSVVISTSDYLNDLKQILRDGGYPQELIFEGCVLQSAGEAEQYFGPSFMRFCEEEVFVDAGCYDFQTSRSLGKHCKRVKKIYAFEPDPYNYQQCVNTLAKSRQAPIIDAEILPYGTWSEKGTLHFSASGDGASHISSEADEFLSVPVTTIDEVVDPATPVTMIKMDIEGSELESLKGAKQTIQRDKPKLAICIYHKTEDLWEIPLYIKELVPEYRLYIRHHDLNHLETVLYAVMP
jgi:methyltransferase, FkbM family